ncbi:MAG: ATP-binding cassette domain-containing protein, partial [Planctomycetaceae bacterium]|nr:ATP-binding cassette domain-containing protein [Planctomycetaceae bacterium]
AVLLSDSASTGKSVLLDLLFGLRSPTRGFITINGASPRELRPRVLRHHVALIRTVEVFEGTIAENVAVGRPDVSTGVVREALALAGILEFVQILPHGIETRIDSSGHPLTTNQLRRLMLARAIAGKPRLMMIDGLLDSFSDDEIRKLVAWLAAAERPWTLILVSQRTYPRELGLRSVSLCPPTSQHSSPSFRTDNTNPGTRTVGENNSHGGDNHGR